MFLKVVYLATVCQLVFKYIFNFGYNLIFKIGNSDLVVFFIDIINEVISGGNVYFISLMHCSGNGLELLFL